MLVFIALNPQGTLRCRSGHAFTAHGVFILFHKVFPRATTDRGTAHPPTPRASQRPRDAHASNAPVFSTLFHMFHPPPPHKPAPPPLPHGGNEEKIKKKIKKNLKTFTLLKKLAFVNARQKNDLFSAD